jgi:hypothetical protein
MAPAPMTCIHPDAPTEDAAPFAEDDDAPELLLVRLYSVKVK